MNKINKTPIPESITLFAGSSLTKGVISLRVFFVILLASLSQTNLAQAESRINYETTYSTNIAGAIGTDQIIRMPGNDAILHGIIFSERNDKLCHLDFRWWRFNDTYFEENIETQFDICDGYNFDYEFLELNNLSGTTLKAIHAINIATKDSGGNLGRIKGAKIFGSYLDRDGNYSVERDPAMQEEFNRKPNHTQWDGKQSCNPGDIAVGVIIEYDSNNNEIVGLGLKCTTPDITHTYGAVPAN